MGQGAVLASSKSVRVDGFSILLRRGEAPKLRRIVVPLRPRPGAGAFLAPEWPVPRRWTVLLRAGRETETHSLFLATSPSVATTEYQLRFYWLSVLSPSTPFSYGATIHAA